MSLIATGLSRSFGRHVAVAHADVNVPAGRICGLVGPNGAGKTTLLLLLAGLLEPDAGSIQIDGAQLEPRMQRSTTGWMPDVFGTWDSLTATEVLQTFAKLYGQRGAAARTRAAELLELVHLTEFADRPAHELSRGQKQRLGFARALVNRPRVLLLDEPASGMDPRSRIELRDQLRALADDGCSILVSSHILGELSEMVDDVILMSAGRTQEAVVDGGHRWRIRLAGQALGQSTISEFADETAAAAALREMIASGAQVVEFSPLHSGIEDAYLALDPERR